ncbi:MAG TPA: FtsX-like permease family protein [Candidatus Krumholzibacteriaceae bacterium]|nr:FtsX-like permease family protein [Candidatus Krumholzibacteriaceae bacterium]
MLFKYSLRNTLRQKRRSLFTVLMMSGGFILCGFTIGWTEGAYDNLINKFTRIWTGHIQIHKGDYLDRPGLYKTIDDYGPLIGDIVAVEGITGAAARIRASGLASIGNKTSGVEITGIAPRAENRTTGFNNRIETGQPFKDEADGSAILGSGLAEVLEAETGDSVAIISQAADGSMAAEIFHIRGTYSTGNDATDRASLYLHIEDAEELFALEGRAHEIIVVCNSLGGVDRAADRLEKRFSERGLDIAAWPEINPVFYRSMKSDKAGAYYSYAIIIIIVAVGVLNTVLMSVLERRKEYGILKALGTRPAQIARMVYIEVGTLALISTIIGSIVTYILLSYFEANGITGFGEMSIGGISVDEYPTKVIPSAFYVSAILIFSSAGLVSVFPAFRAARVEPSKAMITK